MFSFNINPLLLSYPTKFQQLIHFIIYLPFSQSWTNFIMYSTHIIRYISLIKNLYRILYQCHYFVFKPIHLLCQIWQLNYLIMRIHFYHLNLLSNFFSYLDHFLWELLFYCIHPFPTLDFIPKPKDCLDLSLVSLLEFINSSPFQSFHFVFQNLFPSIIPTILSMIILH